MMMGPNTLSGHLSVIYTTECQINLAMRLMEPVLRAVNNSRSSLPFIRSAPDVVEVHPSAEARDIKEVQEKASKLVWASGCTSWFIDPVSKRNSIMFPDWQYRFWFRTVFVRWKDFSYTYSKNWAADARKTGPGAVSLLAVVLSVAIGAYMSWNWYS